MREGLDQQVFVLRLCGGGFAGDTRASGLSWLSIRSAEKHRDK
jgi:hypothetical protein